MAIGEKYAESRNEKGEIQYSLLNEKDFVRFELECALKYGIKILPVLFDDAQMSKEDEFPESLKSIREIHAFRIRTDHWETDFGSFYKELLKKLGLKSSEQSPLLAFQKFLGVEMVSLIEELNQRNVKPRVHGVDLLAFGGNAMALVNFLQRYSPLKSLDDLRRILYWKYNIENKGVPLSGISSREAESLYRAIFDQVGLQERFQKAFERRKRKLNIVLFRRGRHLRDLTNLLKTHPFVSLKIIISATDDGESWYEPALVFHATGIPGAAKALLDLCDDRLIRDFLRHRLTREQAAHFGRILNGLEAPSDKPELNDEAKDLWNKGMRIPHRIRTEVVKLLRQAYNGFKLVRKKKWSTGGLSLNDIPIRSLLLLGAGFSQLDFDELEKLDLDAKELYIKEKVNWQRAVNSLYGLLKIKKDKDDKQHSEVILPCEMTQHLIALRKDGTIYFSEAPINYHDSDSPFLGIWLIQETIDDR